MSFWDFSGTKNTFVTIITFQLYIWSIFSTLHDFHKIFYYVGEFGCPPSRIKLANMPVALGLTFRHWLLKKTGRSGEFSLNSSVQN